MVKLNLGVLAERRKLEVVRPRRPAWYKATEQQQVDYRINLEECLKRVALPGSLDCRDTHCRDEIHSKQRDDFVLNVMGAVPQMYSNGGGKSEIGVTRQWHGARLAGGGGTF